MRQLKLLFIFIGFLFIGALFSSCDDDDPVKERRSAVNRLYNKGTVKIAVANSFVQNQSKMWEGAILAQEKINSEALMPAKMELVKFDDGGTTIKGMTMAYQITSDDEICAVVGHGYSDISLRCSLIYQYYGILMFNFISTIHSLTERNNPLIFSNMPSDSDFADEISRICEQKGLKNIIIYYLENTSGISLSNAFEINCSKRGINIISRDSFDMTTSQQEFDRMAARWKTNFMFDSIFLAGRMPLIQQVISTVRENGINCPIVGSDPFDDPILADNLPESENGKIFAVSNFDIDCDNPKFVEFYSSFEEKFGVEPDQEALQAYDALMVLAGAIKKAGSADPGEIAHSLHQGFWTEAAGSYTFSNTGAVQYRKLTPKVFKDRKFVKLDQE